MKRYKFEGQTLTMLDNDFGYIKVDYWDGVKYKLVKVSRLDYRLLSSIQMQVVKDIFKEKVHNAKNISWVDI